MRCNYKKKSKKISMVETDRHIYYRVAGFYYGSNNVTEFGVFKREDDAESMFRQMLYECDSIDILRYVDGELELNWSYHADIDEINVDYLRVFVPEKTIQSHIDTSIL